MGSQERRGNIDSKVQASIDQSDMQSFTRPETRFLGAYEGMFISTGACVIRLILWIFAILC